MRTKNNSTNLRDIRFVHRRMGLLLFILFIIVAVSGMLLGWKKHLPVLQHPTQQGVSASPSEWLPMDSLIRIANHTLESETGNKLSVQIDKIDARPDKGVVKIVYADHYHSFQIDAVSGEVLSSEYRTSDLIEQIHDGSIIDRVLGWTGGTFKLIYSSAISLALIGCTLTGFWLWYGLKRKRKANSLKNGNI